MSDGLQQRWGLEQPRSAENGSSRQAAQFRTAFQRGMRDVNRSLQYTSAHAQQAPHQTLVGRKRSLLGQYQQVLGRIDPEDPSVARRAVERVIGNVGNLKTESAELQRETEAALQAWQAEEDAFEGTIGKIAELEAWRDEQTAPLRDAVGQIQEQVNDRNYPDAVARFRQLSDDLQPVYEEYERQKAAKEQYEQQLETLRPQLDAALAMEPTASTLQQRDGLTASRDQMETAATERNFVAAYNYAVELLPIVQTYVQAIESEILAWQEKEPAFTEAVGQFDALTEWGEPQTPDLRDAADTIQTQVTERNYAEATVNCDRFLESHRPVYEEYERQKAAKEQYEQQLETLQPQLAAALDLAPTPRTVEQRDALTTNQGQMQTAASERKFVVANDYAAQLPPIIQAYVQAVEAERENLERWKSERLSQLEGIRGELHGIRQAATQDAKTCVERLKDTKRAFAEYRGVFQTALGNLNRELGNARVREEHVNFAWEVVVGAAFGIATAGIGNAAHAGGRIIVLLVSLSEETTASYTAPSNVFDSFQGRSAADWDSVLGSAIDCFNRYVEVIERFQELDYALDTQITWLRTVDMAALSEDSRRQMDVIDRVAVQNGSLSSCDPVVSRSLAQPSALAAKLAEKGPTDVEREIAIQWISNLSCDETDQIDGLEDYLVRLNVIRAGGDGPSELGVDVGGLYTSETDEEAVHERARQHEALHRAGRRLVGRTGEMRRSGSVVIEGAAYSAECRDGTLEAGRPVVVLDYVLTDGAETWRSRMTAQYQTDPSLRLIVQAND